MKGKTAERALIEAEIAEINLLAKEKAEREQIKLQNERGIDHEEEEQGFTSKELILIPSTPPQTTVLPDRTPTRGWRTRAIPAGYTTPEAPTQELFTQAFEDLPEDLLEEPSKSPSGLPTSTAPPRLEWTAKRKRRSTVKAQEAGEQQREALGRRKL